MMLRSPGVSVIVPAFNASASLPACLRSIRAQTFAAREIIVVDDGSTDETEQVVRSCGDDIVYIAQKNQGPSAARNRGLAAATQPMVAFLDADDYWHERFLERCLGCFDSYPSIIAVSTALAVRTLNGEEIALPSLPMEDKSGKGPIIIDNFFETWAVHDHIRTGSSLFRREVLVDVGGFREDLRIAEDLEYWGYLGTVGPWGFVPEPLWIGNSLQAASGSWRAKHQRRGALCPTVEDWEQRLAPRIPPQARPHFEIVRGRVAAGYAYAKILGGDPTGALRIVERYGGSMPRTKVRALLRAGARLGPMAWQAAVGVVRVYEMLKAMRLARVAQHRGQ